MDINKIKAGKYQLVVQRWDRQTSKPGEPFTFDRFSRGDEVTLSEEEARRLVPAGAAVTPGSLEKAQAERAAAQLRAALNQVPDDVRAALLEQHGLTGGGTTAHEPSVASDVQRPGDSDSVATWRSYAVERGVPAEEAAKLDRKAIIDRFPVE